MKKIAIDEFEVAEVMANLTEAEKLERVKALYPYPDEVLEILGYYDDSMDDDDLLFVDEHENGRDEAAYLLAINNGNFEESIARNVNLPI